jgi:hypothetical protein
MRRSDSVTKKVTPFLPAALEREIESVLSRAKVYKIDSCGWLNENDPDPDLIGHAMWQTDQPSIDYNALFGENPVARRPDDVEKEILTAGEDFYGLMESSRLSIGLTLLWHPQARGKLLSESPFFHLHYTDAFIKLAIACDRIRDLLVIACTGASAADYKNQKDNSKRNRRYVTPYQDAQMLLSGRGLKDERLADSLIALPRLAQELYTYLERRNEIVHEIATPMAILTRNMVTELQQQHDREREQGFSPRSNDPKDWLPASKAAEEENRTRVDHMTVELRDWYELLIRTSNYVFQVEYWSRVLGSR